MKLDERPKTDGIWRPEPWPLNGKWLVTKYVRFKDGILRAVDETRRRGRVLTNWYDTEQEAQQRAEKLNASARS